MPYKKSAQSASQIISSATKVLARQGYARTSLMDIAREAGMSKGAVHYHFSTKESLIGEVLRTALERVQERTLHAWAEAEADGDIAAVRSSLHELWRIRSERSEEAVIIADLLAQSLHDDTLRPRLAEFFNDASAQMRDHLSEHLERLGLQSKISMDILPRLMLGLLDGLMMQSYVDEDGFDVDATLSAVEVLAFSLLDAAPTK